MEIRQKTIDKTVAYLNKLNTFNVDRTFTTKQGIHTRKEFKVNSNLNHFAIQAGYIKRVGQARYKTTITKFEPIHARRVIELFYMKYPIVKKTAPAPVVEAIIKPKPVKPTATKALVCFGAYSLVLTNLLILIHYEF